MGIHNLWILLNQEGLAKQLEVGWKTHAAPDSLCAPQHAP